jgi:hypothetical protein
MIREVSWELIRKRALGLLVFNSSTIATEKSSTTKIQGGGKHGPIHTLGKKIYEFSPNNRNRPFLKGQYRFTSPCHL